jgi:CubicO group peptidase (beta-lactamase class C family)
LIAMTHDMMSIGRRELLAMGAGTLLMPTTLRAAPAAADPWLSRLADAATPGMSVALIEGGRIRWARGFGLANREGDVPVTAATRFQAASISKPVAALGALRLVDQGVLSLDEPVVARLKGWRPKGDEEAWSRITLRQLVSHTAGLTVHGFGGYANGVPLPSAAQVLTGGSPANSEAVRPAFPAGTWRYSGGGFTVMQQLMTDATGKEFSALMDELVLRPLGMRSSSYMQPPVGDRDRAWAYKDDGTLVPGHWHVYPEQAAVGLWTTPSDLARFAIALMPGHQHPALRKAAELIRTPQPGADARGGPFGLGLFLSAPAGPNFFYHGGANAGFRCMMVGLPETGQGAAIMTNGDRGGDVYQAMLLALAEAGNWPERTFQRIFPAVKP